MDIFLADLQYKTVNEIMEKGKGLKRDFKMGILEVHKAMPGIWDHTLLVPGRPEIVDYTDYINDGLPAFKSRVLTIVLDQQERDLWHHRADYFASFYHGKKVNILFTDDEDHYFIGRILLDKKRLNLLYNEFTLTITCNPYRYILPTLATQFNEIEPANPSAVSERFPCHLGAYLGAVSVSYSASETRSAYIYVYKENVLVETHTLSPYIYYDEIMFGVSGDVELAFRYLERVSLDGINIEV